jgi:hypothetical protein
MACGVTPCCGACGLIELLETTDDVVVRALLTGGRNIECTEAANATAISSRDAVNIDNLRPGNFIWINGGRHSKSFAHGRASVKSADEVLQGRKLLRLGD